MDFKQYLDANIENYIVNLEGGQTVAMKRAIEDWSELNPEKTIQIWSQPSEISRSGYRFVILPKDYVSYHFEKFPSWKNGTLLLDGTHSECRQKHRDTLAEMGYEIEWRRPV